MVIESMIDTPVAYTQGVIALDDFGREIEIIVDDTDVDISTIDEYTVTFIAEDFTGHTTEVEVTLFIIPIDPKEVDDWIDEKLKEILEDGMTHEERVRAIFDSVRKNISHGTGLDDKWIGSVYTAAHWAINNPRGDYYHFYALSELMLTHAEITNIRIVRSEDSKMKGEHFWNLVYYDGDGWYHYDSMKVSDYTAVNSIQHKFTDEDAKEIIRQLTYSRAGGEGYYDYDKHLYPDVAVD